MDFKYKINSESLPEELQKVVVDLSPDPEVFEFIDECKKEPYTKWQGFLYDVLSKFVPLFDIDAILGMYPLFILSRKNWERIIPEEKHGGSLLDIGAGQGLVTANAKPFFNKIITTETSRFVARRLRRKGFTCLVSDIAKDPDLFKSKEFDVVSILNVLDRAEYPVTLLKNSLNFLKDNGFLVVTTPIPIKPAVWTTVSNKPKESFIIDQSGSFEDCVNDFYENTIKPQRLTPVLLGRLPYICKCDDIPYVRHYDNFLMVLKK